MIKLPKYFGLIIIASCIYISILYFFDFMRKLPERDFSLIFNSISSAGLVFVFINNIKNKMSGKVERYLLFKIIPLICFILLVSYFSYVLYYTYSYEILNNSRSIFFQIFSFILALLLIIYIVKDFIIKNNVA